jgi:hypothetical protein
MHTALGGGDRLRRADASESNFAVIVTHAVAVHGFGVLVVLVVVLFLVSSALLRLLTVDVEVAVPV